MRCVIKKNVVPSKNEESFIYRCFSDLVAEVRTDILKNICQELNVLLIA